MGEHCECCNEVYILYDKKLNQKFFGRGVKSKQTNLASQKAIIDSTQKMFLLSCHAVRTVFCSIS